MYACSNAGGSARTSTDVCRVPPGIPVALSNASICQTGNNNVPHINMVGGSVHNLNTVVNHSLEDESGTLLGVISNEIQGHVKYLTGANTVLVCGSPMARVTSVTDGNAQNKGIGSQVVPSQSKVLILAA